MNVKTAVTAKILGEIIAEGMSICEVDLTNTVNSEAINILTKISDILEDGKLKNDDKLVKIKGVIDFMQADG